MKRQFRGTKPCFCGGNVAIRTKKGKGFYCRCPRCGWKIIEPAKSIKEAVNKWNSFIETLEKGYFQAYNTPYAPPTIPIEELNSVLYQEAITKKLSMQQEESMVMVSK